MKKAGNLIILHIMFMLFSLGAVASKTAANSEFLSPRFLFFYGIVLVGLAIYAIVWQQMLKRLPLVTAYANKAVTVVWGIIWGRVFFGEAVTPRKVIGAIIVISGVCIVVMADKEKDAATETAVNAQIVTEPEANNQEVNL
ncbi:MAG: DMT family transporter [Lachnospiraceae bacterium]|nr:DMT family transporter [Lachnospiraceae bacterium]